MPGRFIPDTIRGSSPDVGAKGQVTLRTYCWRSACCLLLSEVMQGRAPRGAREILHGSLLSGLIVIRGPARPHFLLLWPKSATSDVPAVTAAFAGGFLSGIALARGGARLRKW